MTLSSNLQVHLTIPISVIFVLIHFESSYHHHYILDNEKYYFILDALTFGHIYLLQSLQYVA